MSDTLSPTPSLCPQVKELLDFLASFNYPPLSELGAEQAREGIRRMAATKNPTPLLSVENRSIPSENHEIPVRIYRPNASPSLPVMVYCHGGGWVLCDLDTHDESCRRLAKQAECVVVSVDYRLAPEHPFPVPFDDTYKALEWVHANADKLDVDPNRISVGGDSAGGNIVAGVALKARDEKGPKIHHQLLIYPVTNVSSLDTQSYRDFDTGYRLQKAEMAWFIDQYLGEDADRSHSWVSPLLEKNLAGLPPTYLATAGFDVLRDEGEAYADALRAAGVAVEFDCFHDQVHGFMAMAHGIESSKKALDVIAARFRRGIHGE